MQQLPLGIRIPDRAVFGSFLPAGNLQAVEHLRRVARNEMGGVTWLCGANGVGKTHLLQAVCAEADARSRVGYFPLATLSVLGVGVLDGLPQLDCVCFDDLDRIVGALEWEQGLFGLFREIEERSGRLVVSAPTPPALLKWTLPDIGSRFTAAAIFQMRPLEESERGQALQLHAHARGFELPDETARWLMRHHPRDMRTLFNLLDTLDEAALIAQRRLTIPFIREVLRGGQTPA